MTDNTHQPSARTWLRNSVLAAVVGVLGLAFTSLSGASAVAAEAEGAHDKAPKPIFDLTDAARIEAGEKRFNKVCAAYCHGIEGSGGRAPDFKGRTDLSVEETYNTIFHGRTTADVMPAWGAAYSAEQIWELVAYIQYLGTQ
jgi:mono/diheme cytochrome c family protein